MQRISRKRKWKKVIVFWVLLAVLMAEPQGAAVVCAAQENGAEFVTVSPSDEGEDAPSGDTGQAGEDRPPASGNENGVEDGTQDGKLPSAGEAQEPSGEETEGSQDAAGGGTQGPESGEEDGEPDGGEENGEPGNGEEDGESGNGEEDGEPESGEGDGTQEPEPDGEMTSPEDGLSEEALSEEEQLLEDMEEGEEPEEILSGEELPEDESEKEEDLGGFTGMPDSYRLSSTQISEKRLLADNMEDVDESAEGVLYVEREVVTLAQSEKEAGMIARAYNAGIKSFEDGLLVLELEEQTTVRDAIQAAASARTALPAVWPNYYRYVHGDVAQQESGNALIEIEEEEYVPDPEGDVPVAESNGLMPESDVMMAESNGLMPESDVMMAESDVPASEAYAQAVNAFDDPYLKATSSNYQWQHVAVGSPYAWSEGYRGAGIKVAVLDSGVNASHADLQIRENISKVTGVESAEDGLGHGTHVAGIIGARANNGKGGAGIAPEAEIYNIRVMNEAGIGTDADIIAGLTEAVNLDVDIVNMSLGGAGFSGVYQTKITEAYEAGIAVIVSAGNDGVSNINYPACYDHVICVAATDTDNNRAHFSTCGSWVDLSAPGENILSTYHSSNTSHAFMSGTSMACPVVSGEAAVLLGSCEPLKNMDKDSDRVDALEKVMKSNCVRAAGTGMGSGIPSLTRIFKLSTAVTRPTAPVIEIVPDDQSKAQKVTVTIGAQGGLTIYYTDNGKTPAFRNGEPNADAIQYTGPFDLENRARATIKAIAVNENGASSAVKSVNYTLKPYVTDIEISGVQQVAPGKSIQLSAQITPAYAANKQVAWELKNADGTPLSGALAGQLKISAGGRVTAGKTAPSGVFKAVATAQDDGKKTAEYEIEVISGIRVKSVRFLREKTGTTALKSVLLSLPGQNTYDFEKHLVPTATIDGVTLTAADFKWTSSNRQIAEVDGAGVVTAKKAGKVTITALSNDSGNKKASCTVTVKQLATGLNVSGPVSVAAGRSVTFLAEVTPKDTTNKKVVWSLHDERGEVTKARAKELGVSIHATSGRLTTKAGATGGNYKVRAVTADGSGILAEAEVRVLNGSIEKFTFSDRKDNKLTLYRKKAASDTQTQKRIEVAIKAKGAADLDAYKVTSSNPGIATAEVSGEVTSGEGKTITLIVSATGRAAGKTNITVASTDGTNRKLTCAVTVKNPVSRLHISAKTVTASGGSGTDMCVVMGKSIQLKATLESEYGKVSGKGVTWSINAPAESGVKISSTGKVTASKTAEESKIWTVTAVAKDGSCVKDTYRVVVVPKATYVTASGLYEGRNVNEFDDYFPHTPDSVQKGYKYVIYTDVKGGYVQASSSNQKIVEVTMIKEKGVRKLYVTPRKPGTATITLKTTDGSGVKISYKVRVKEKEE